MTKTKKKNKFTHKNCEKDGYPVITGKQLAEIMQVNRRTIQRHVKDRGMPKLGMDRYDICEVWRWQVEQITHEVEGKAPDSGRLLRAQADERESRAAILSIRRAEAEGRMVEREVMEVNLLDRALAVKKQMELLADNLTERIMLLFDRYSSAKKDRQKNTGEMSVLIRETIERSTRECMEAFAQEPGEFSTIEKDIAKKLSTEIASKICDDDDIKDGESTVYKILDQYFPAVIGSMVKN